ncbi:hypothetical protein PNEG_00903 [Pneumocystis murina B123]|uniref:Transmembrane protein 242 n=1 Tax=Pneumocystis murina (strain B123) TaxID=1069680 RepID=M7PJZ4_PNEMU|nr:hypothetical protein PNEG_00903 [Pneumocystis murina B123]EMR10754.1 hypothetical protein PNEG_00903 [Pneumocystis murina B123]
MSKNDSQNQWRYLLIASTVSLAQGLCLSYKYMKAKQGSFPANSVLFALKALGIGTLICFGTFGLGVATISKVLKVKNIEEFSYVMKDYAKKYFSSLKLSSEKADYEDIDEKLLSKKFS